MPEPEVNKLLRMVIKHQGSALHLSVGLPPMLRLKGLIRQMDLKPLTHEDMERLLFPILGQRERQVLEETGGVEHAYAVGQNEGRFRVSLFQERGELSLVAYMLNTPNFQRLTTDN